jgi:Hydrazine synthase alpha subunit middle domain
MTSAARVLATAASMAILIPICGFSPDAAQNAGAKIGADIIVTAAPVYEPLAALRGGERFPKGAQLLLVHAGKSQLLVAGFAASADANVSFDGKRVLFAGKQAASDSWQIWELTLENHSLRKLIGGEGDAIRPFYLPFGRLVYARRTARGFHLEAAGADADNAIAPIDANAGSTLLQLSYLPASAIPVDVLLDGRILFEAGFPLGSGSTPELFLVYSDGSGVESYRCDHGRARWGGKQLASGDVVFTHGDSLARFTSPLAAEAHIVAPRAEYSGAIAEAAAGDWLVSSRPGTGTHYALRALKPGETTFQTVLAQSGQDLVEPAIVAPRTRPKRHPSGLHDWNYANTMALDARLSRAGDMKTAPACVRLETLDAAGHAVVTGTAPVEPDGSFFVKTPADRPIRFALLDQKGAIVRQEHGWFWIRRGEQRICVGCHTGPERSSDNRLPAVLGRTTTPSDLSGANDLGEGQHAAPKGN